MRIRHALLCVIGGAALSILAPRDARAQATATSPEPAKPAVGRGPVDQPGRVAGDASKKGSPSKVDALTIKQGAVPAAAGGAPGGSSSRDDAKRDRGAAPASRDAAARADKKDEPMGDPVQKVDSVSKDMPGIHRKGAAGSSR